MVNPDFLDEAAVPRVADVGDDNPEVRIVQAAHFLHSDANCHGAGLGVGQRKAPGPGIPPRRAIIFPTLPIFCIILRIIAKRLSRSFTSVTEVPLPFAMRSRLFPFRISG